MAVPVRADLVATVRWGNEWDIAAAALIAKEAGAAVTDLEADAAFPPPKRKRPLEMI